ncbi:MAG: prolipoprotein diacylglyceryl transferase [Dehalococcoidia bacterium]|nr:prolipoprotein diacylglyceryl transferase [Dehalococcoidia bacterium]
MFTIGVDPVAFTIGSYPVRWYGIMVAVAVATLLVIFSREAKRRSISEDFVYNIFLWGVVGGLVMSRVVHVVDYLVTHPGEPMQILNFSGLGLYGAILGAVLGVWVYCRVRKIPWSNMAVVGDAVAVGGPLAQAIGRLGCTINGCCYGRPSSLPWAVVYTHPQSFCGLKGVPLHPTQVYFLLWNLVVFAVVWRMRSWTKPQGCLFLLYLCLYCVGDFALRFFRVNDPFLLGLQQGQVISVAVLSVALALFILKIRRVREMA